MKKLGLLFSFFWAIQAIAQSFYDQNTIQTVEVFFPFTNWDYRLDTAKSGSEGYILADSVRVNGTTFVDCGVKYKGNSSYNANNNKNPFHIELNYVHSGASYQGYKDIKLGNGFADPSFIREVLGYDILSNYMDCPKANFANLYVNGSLRGVYSNTENIGKRFNADHYYSSANTHFKCTPPGGVNPQSGVFPDLKYLGTDSSLYFDRYELKSKYGWNELVRMTDTLNNFTSFVESNIDIDRALWMFAFNNVFVNLDSYSGSFKQNYNLYKDDNKRFIPTSWDLNMSFGGFSGGGGGGGGGSSSSLSPLYNATSTAHPLLSKLLANASYKKMYIAHCRTMLNEMISSDDYITKANVLRAVIDAAVNADPYKLYTYTQFQNSLTTNTTGGGGGGGGSIPGLQLLMDARETYLLATTEYTQTPPTISAQSATPLSPAFNSNVTVNATVTNATSVYIGFRYDKPQRFYRVAMYDDGAHGDGAAGDNVYGVSIPVYSGEIQYYIYAENANAGIFSPQRAEHEFHSIYAQSYAPTANQLVINEFQANNTIIEDSYNEEDDWVELYNNSNSLLDLSGLYLSDTLGNLQKWAFPAHTTLNPNEYLTVWTDDDEWQLRYHSNFNLSSTGEKLILSNSAGQILDSVSFANQIADVSYGRCPNATGAFQSLTTSSFEAMNTGCSTAVEEAQIPLIDLVIYPNPVTDNLHILSNAQVMTEISLWDVSGKLLAQYQPNSLQAELDMENLPSGIYTVRVTNELGQSSSKKVVK